MPTTTVMNSVTVVVVVKMIILHTVGHMLKNSSSQVKLGIGIVQLVTYVLYQMKSLICQLNSTEILTFRISSIQLWHVVGKNYLTKRKPKCLNDLDTL